MKLTKMDVIMSKRDCNCCDFIANFFCASFLNFAWVREKFLGGYM